jgi:hypothetical protein
MVLFGRACSLLGAWRLCMLCCKESTS